MLLVAADFMVSSKTIVFDDAVIDLFKNDLLHRRPFLIRFSTYNIDYEIRFSKEDIVSFAKTLLELSKDEQEN